MLVTIREIIHFLQVHHPTKISELLTKGSLLKDIKQISGQDDTSPLEAFHSVYNNFAAKMLAFFIPWNDKAGMNT